MKSSELSATEVDESRTSFLLFPFILFILFIQLKHNYIVFPLPVFPAIPSIYPPLFLSKIHTFFSLIIDMYNRQEFLNI